MLYDVSLSSRGGVARVGVSSAGRAVWVGSLPLPSARRSAPVSGVPCVPGSPAVSASSARRSAPVSGVPCVPGSPAVSASSAPSPGASSGVSASAVAGCWGELAVLGRALSELRGVVKDGDVVRIETRVGKVKSLLERSRRGTVGTDIAAAYYSCLKNMEALPVTYLITKTSAPKVEVLELFQKAFQAKEAEKKSETGLLSIEAMMESLDSE